MNFITKFNSYICTYILSFHSICICVCVCVLFFLFVLSSWFSGLKKILINYHLKLVFHKKKKLLQSIILIIIHIKQRDREKKNSQFIAKWLKIILFFCYFILNIFLKDFFVKFKLNWNFCDKYSFNFCF